jgi:hypothetical protein
MTTVWAMLGNAFYLALVLDGWVRVDDYVDGHGLVAMVRTDRIKAAVPDQRKSVAHPAELGPSIAEEDECP